MLLFLLPFIKRAYDFERKMVSITISNGTIPFEVFVNL